MSTKNPLYVNHLQNRFADWLCTQLREISPRHLIVPADRVVQLAGRKQSGASSNRYPITFNVVAIPANDCMPCKLRSHCHRAKARAF